MRVWSMSSRRTKSIIISWHGSTYRKIDAHQVPQSTLNKRKKERRKETRLFLRINSVWRTQKFSYQQLSRLVTKQTKWHVRPAKTQISLGVRPSWSKSSLSAWRKRVSLATHWAHSEDSDQTGRLNLHVVLHLSQNGSTNKNLHEPRHEKTCLRAFPTRSDSNWSAQLQKPARVLKFWL